MRKTFLTAVAMRFLTLAVALSSGVVLAQKPADVHGWGKVKWGMTLAQIQKLYPEAEPFTKTWEDGRKSSGLRIPKFDLIHFPFEVTFWKKDADKRLDSISLSTEAGMVVFRELEKQLTLKYGSPTLKDDSKPRKRSRTWMFPSTEIELLFLEWLPPAPSEVNLGYSPVDKGSRDKL